MPMFLHINSYMNVNYFWIQKNDVELNKINKTKIHQ